MEGKVRIESSNYKINTEEVIKGYHHQILQLKKDLGLKWNMWSFTPFKAKSTDIIPALLKMPDVLIKGEENLDDNEWDRNSERDRIKLLIIYCNFRLDEGKKLEEDISSRINKLSSLIKRNCSFCKRKN